MPLFDSADFVNLALQTNAFNLPLSVAALLPQTKVRGMAEGKRFGLAAHKTEYMPGEAHEMKAWYVSLMLVEYVAVLLFKKVQDGHCNAEGHPPCDEMRAEHRRMFKEYRSALETLLSEVRELEAQLK
jgi:hypothetical protein